MELLAGVRSRDVTPVLMTTPGQSKYLVSEPAFLDLEAHAVYPERYLRYFMSRRGPSALAEMPAWLRRLPDLGALDLIHSVEAYPWAYYARGVAKRLRTPYVFTIHGDYGWIAHRRVPDKWMYEVTLRDASCICPVSSAGAAMLERHFPNVCRERVRVIHNGVDVGLFRPIAESRRRCRVAGAGLRVLTVARVTPVKGLETAIAAFVEAREAGVKATYRIVGGGTGGAYHSSLVASIPERFRADVTFTGPLPFAGVVSEYEAADVFLLTSRTVGERMEGLPLVVLEAAACGLPVIATRNGGIPEGVCDGLSGFLINEGDVTGAARALTILATDSAYADSMSDNALRWITGFDNSRRVSAYLDIYDHIGQLGKGTECGRTR